MKVIGSIELDQDEYRFGQTKVSDFEFPMLAKVPAFLWLLWAPEYASLQSSTTDCLSTRPFRSLNLVVIHHRFSPRVFL